MEDYVYYALVASNNKVLKCMPVIDDTEFEIINRQYPSEWLDGKWVRVCNNQVDMCKIPCQGWNYLPEKNLFYPPRPHVSWKLNDHTMEWEAPSPQPEGRWYWNEDEKSWAPFSDDVNNGVINE